MGYLDLDKIAEVLGVSHLDDLRTFMKELLSSTEENICRSLRIPSECSPAELPLGNSIRCGQCGRMVNLVPCVLCNCGTKRRRARATKDMRIPEHPTKFAAGSLEKIEVMAERVSRGESPFHPDDALVLVNRSLQIAASNAA
jgi:hypothetical protein